ncbi:class I SAM-dependent methyltransferase [Polyangium fumosum]|uniref:Methyltransferase domain-containing protein n=1 Tax=Polyangium fumosum TaxID=889272 RepID=A0A4U1JFE8_9BACT|nr:class I SAM-dependent methyltransferase [Polyangium fumosum]TKD09723.1 hypothetical protein E8A74_11165 [Polyangium fumosum]
MSTAASQTPVHPSMVLGAYLERLVRARRVAVLGDATLELAERLVERGARLVHAYDPDAARAAEAFARTAQDRDRHVMHAVLAGDLGVRDGAFDVVVLPDLSIFADPSDVLRRARKLVGTAGIAVIASPNPDASRRLLALAAPRGKDTSPPGYYALYDLVSLQFPVVRMLGQAPFVGYTVADFAAGPDLEVSVDTSLLKATEEPEHFIAIASERKVSVDAFVVVELSLSEVRDAIGTAGAKAADTGRVKELEAALAVHDERKRADEKSAEERAAAAVATAARVVELEAKLERLRDVDTRAGDTHVRAERLTHQIRDLDEELRRQRDRATKLAKQLDDEKKSRTKAEVELGLARGRPEIPGAKERIEQLTAELSATRSRALELEGELSAAGVGLEELSNDRAGLRARVAELELRLAAQEAAAREPDPGLLSRVAQLEAALERSEATRQSAVRRADELAETLAATTAERLHLAEKTQTLEKQTAALLAERAASESLAPEIDALEAQLRARGHRITVLEAELREGLRVGKELVEELETLRGAAVAPAGEAAPPAATPQNGAPVPPSTLVGHASAREAAPAETADATPVDDTETMKTQLDTLAARAARSEADLKAAEWRIAQLELALASAERGEGEPAAVAVELEQALLAAHQELATLRRAVGPEGGHVAPGVVEQAVLLHQISNLTMGDSAP